MNRLIFGDLHLALELIFSEIIRLCRHKIFPQTARWCRHEIYDILREIEMGKKWKTKK